MPSPLGSGHCGVKNPHQDSPSPSLTHSRPRPSTLLSPHGFQLSGTWFPIPGTDACPQMRARNVGTGLSKKAGERSLLSPHCPAAPKTILGTEELMPNTGHTVGAQSTVCSCCQLMVLDMRRPPAQWLLHESLRKEGQTNRGPEELQALGC